jgi:toxin-antitoxin system PIN domain toxin
VRLVDANLLVYATFQVFPQHKAARDWLAGTLSEPQRLGLPWPSLLAFIRLASNPRILRAAISVKEAWEQVELWLDCPAAWVPQPGQRHRHILRALLTGASVGSRHVPDAHLAALAIEHGLILCSADGNFARFPGLRWENPLA